MNPKSSLEIIIPVLNESETLPLLFSKLETCFSPDACRDSYLDSVRFIFIDDGSTDSTAKIIADRIHKGFPAALFRLSRNYGHQNALNAGFDQSRADIVAVIDADLQDPPELVHQMIQKLRQGHDVVYGERRRRAGNPFKKIMYWLFYRLLAFISDVPVPVDAGDFCVMRREVILAMQSLPEKLRFVRGLRSWVGFRQVSFPYDRPERRAGQTKYTLNKLYQLATDGVASMSIRPLRITQATLFFSLVIMGGFLIVTVERYHALARENPAALWFLFTYLLVVFTSSLQIFCLYIIGAYIGRMYLEVKGRPPYVIMEIIAPEKDARSSNEPAH